MDKELNNNELALMELIESKPFDGLSAEEQAFVLSMISKSEYELQNEILMEGAYLGGTHVARPLLVPAKKGFVVPLYQAIGGIAAAVAISFFVFKGDTYISDSHESSPTATVDTLYIEKTVVDTVVEYQKEYIDRVVLAKEEPTPNVQLSENITVPQYSSISDLPATKNNGNALATDKTFALVKSLRFN